MKGIVVLCILFAGNVLAMPNTEIYEALFEQYPAVRKTKLASCMTCHTIDKWQRNSYGRDLQVYLRKLFEDTGRAPDPSKYSKHMIMKGLKDIELADSDDDGFSNLEEMLNDAFPGEASDHPERPVW